MFPFAPHLGAEVYELLTGRWVWEDPWPDADPDMLLADTFELENVLLVSALNTSDALSEVLHAVSAVTRVVAAFDNEREFLALIHARKQEVDCRPPPQYR